MASGERSQKPEQPSRAGSARAKIIAALGEALSELPWSAISLNDIAVRSGVSRQTVYNEFGSRSGLALSYLSGLVASLIAGNVPDAASAARKDPHAGLLLGFGSFFEAAANEPLLSQVTGEPGQVRVLGGLVEPQALVEHASALLADAYASEWENASKAEAGLLARAVVRLCLSYLIVPPPRGCDPAAEMAALLAPWIDQRS